MHPLRCNRPQTVWYVTVVILAWLWSTSASLAANTDLEEAFSTYQTAAMRTWRLRLKPEFLKVARPKDRARIEQIDFKVVRFSDFNAFANYPRRRVELPVGFLVILDVMADAVVLTWHQPDLAHKLQNYPIHLAEQYRNAARGKKVTVKEFPEFAGFPIAGARRLREQDDYYNLKVEFIVNSLALIVGHELGHLVLEHQPTGDISPKQSRQHEYEADAFGTKLAVDAGFVVAAGLATSFAMFVAIDGGNSQGPLATHPPTVCRIQRLGKVMIKQVDAIDADKGEKALRRIGKSRDSMLRDLAKLREACEQEER